MPASANFNGSSQTLDYQNASAGPHVDVSYPFAFSLWWNADVVTGGSKYIMSMYDQSAGQWAGIRINSGSLFIAATTTFTNVGSVSAGTWYYCVCEFNSTTDRKMYLNTAQFGSTGTASSDPLSGGNLDASSVGRLVDGSSGTSFYFDGKIAFPQIYNQALSINEQKLIMRNPFALPENLVWFPNMQVAGSVVGDYLDLSGKEYNPNAGTVPATSDDGVPVFYPLRTI